MTSEDVRKFSNRWLRAASKCVPGSYDQGFYAGVAEAAAWDASGHQGPLPTSRVEERLKSILGQQEDGD